MKKENKTVQKKDTKKGKLEKQPKNKNNKTKKENKFIQTIKKKWLIDGTKTFILVAIIIAIFISINIFMEKLELEPIDLTQEKLYTLSEEAKERVKDINEEVKIYFVGYEDGNSNLDLAKQYNKVNENITAEAVDVNERIDIAQKYEIESGSQGIIVESGSRSKVLTAQDLVTYDTSTGETISIVDEKLTNAIISVTTAKVPKIYFLNGYTDFTLDQYLYYLKTYLANEVTEVDSFDVLTTGKVPDDCDTLVITTPNKDFDDIATNAIMEYIKSGRNILWFNATIINPSEMTNVNKILAEYGVNPFESGTIRETDKSKMIQDQPGIIIPNTIYSTITKNIYNSTGVILINPTKVNIMEQEKLEELKVETAIILESSEASYFRTNITNSSASKTEDEEQGSFIIGAELTKTIKEKDEETGTSAIVSKLVIYGENYFISDLPLSQSTQYPALQYANNKNLAINSMAYLVDREEDITARKSTGTVTYTATEEQNTIIQIIIFAVPLLIILAGIIVWQKRRRKK